MATHNNNKQPRKKAGKANNSLTMTSPKQRQGSYFEQQACTFLQQQGLVLIAQNWQRPKVGELDLVMIEPGPSWSTIVFIEVRQRLRSSFGDAALSVTAAKQRKIIKTAQYFLLQHPKYSNYDCRFDVIAYNIDKPIKDSVTCKKAIASNLDISSNVEPKTEPNLHPDYQPEWLIGAFIASAW